MTEYLVIRLGETPGQSVTWIAVDDRGTRRGHPGSGTLGDAAREVRDRPVIALVPATDVLTTSAEIPTKSKSKILAALPGALEEQVADDIDRLQFAPGERLANGRLRVAVVAKSLLEDWIGLLADAGIEASRIVPEHHGLASTPNTLTMMIADGVVMFNDGDDTVFAIPDISPAEAIAATGYLGDEELASGKHLVVYCDAASNDTFEKDWALLRHDLASVDVNLLADGPLPKLAVTVAAGGGINLLQGNFGARTEMSAVLRPWRYAAVFIVALGAVALIGKGADYYRLSVEHAALKDQFGEVYCEILPEANCDVVDPAGTVASLRRSVGGASSGSQSFLPSMLELAQAVSQDGGAEVEAVTYRAGVITVRINAPDIPTLDRIVQALGQSGRFTAEMRSANNVGDRVDSRIEIREVGA